MQHYWSLEHVQLNASWLTIGSFDGVHLGHQEIVRKLTAGAHDQGAPAVVLTFYPHPSIVLGRRQRSLYLTTPDERAELLGELGVDVVITYPFSKETAQMTAREYMTRLSNHLKMQHVWVGYDFALGRKREGDINMLRSLGEELGYVLDVIPPIELDGEVISSSAIREYLGEGRVEDAARLLGRPYSITGQVTHGDGRGRTIGIPTSNLSIWEERVIINTGVYLCNASAAGKSYSAVVNVGRRPTFESEKVTPRIEAHLLDFSGVLYGESMRLEFLARIRDERRFPDAQALVAQIHLDIENARKFLAEHPELRS